MTRSRVGTQRMAELERLGPYFAVAASGAGVTSSGPWRPFVELVERPEALRGRAEAVREVLASGIRRPPEEVSLTVSASVVQLGITARVLSPVLGLAALHGVDRAPSTVDLQWQESLAGTFPLAVPVELLTASAATDPDWAGWAGQVAELLGRISRAVADLVPSPQVRAGNIASAVHGAVGALSRAPDVAGAARRRGAALAGRLLTAPALQDTSTGSPGTGGFRRRSCCLLYRVTGLGTDDGTRPVCGDCVLQGGRYRRAPAEP